MNQPSVVSTSEISRPRALRLGALKWAVLAICLAGLAGCASPLDNLNINDTFGSIGRRAKNKADEIKASEADGPPVGQAEFEAAFKLYEDKTYDQARKAFHKIVKNKKWKDEPVVEDSMFYRAESDFQMGKFASAQDGYDELLKAHPTTKHLEKSVQRLFVIGRYWLGTLKPPEEVELACFSSEDGAAQLEQHPDGRIPFQWDRVQPNISDKTRPFFDTPGRGVQALKSVSLHDPQSTLAVKATMNLAMFFLRKHDYHNADSYFTEIRTLHNDNKIKDLDKYQETALVLGAHAKYKTYLGAAYDGKPLKEARDLIKQALTRYPNSKYEAKLRKDLLQIEWEWRERDWQTASYYLKRGEYTSASVYLEDLVNKHPGTEQAEKAKEALLKMDPKYSAGLLRVPLIPPVPSEAEDSPKESSEGEEPGRLKDAEEGASRAPVDE